MDITHTMHHKLYALTPILKHCTTREQIGNIFENYFAKRTSKYYEEGFGQVEKMIQSALSFQLDNGVKSDCVKAEKEIDKTLNLLAFLKFIRGDSAEEGNE
jgi:hypothetical protein